MASFFRLPGRIRWGSDTVQVELRLERVGGSRASLSVLHQRVEVAPSRLLMDGG